MVIFVLADFVADWVRVPEVDWESMLAGITLETTLETIERSTFRRENMLIKCGYGRRKGILTLFRKLFKLRLVLSLHLIVAIMQISPIMGEAHISPCGGILLDLHLYF
jgi:hypothetical protein